MKRVIAVLLFVLFSASAEAVTLYAKTAGGNWTAAGTWSNVNAGGVDNSGPPLAADTCIFEALSGNVTVDTGAVCGSMSMIAGTGNYSGTLTHTAAVTLAISGSVTFTAGATYTLGNAATSALSILATGTLTTAGKTVGNLTMVNVTLGDALASSGTALTLTSGAFTAGGFGVTLNGAGTATITGAFTGANSFAALTRAGTAVKTDVLSLTGAVTCTGAFTVTGNSAINRVLVQSSTVGTARTLTADSSSTNANADWTDITAAGAGTPFAGTSMGNALGNTLITFDGASTQTHTASAGGNWSDVTKWTSRIPLPQDNAVIDVNTTGTLTQDMPRIGANIDFTGFAGTVSWGVTVTPNIYGNLTYGAAMTNAGATSVVIQMVARSAVVITSNGVSGQCVAFAGAGGTFTLADALTQLSSNNGTPNWGQNSSTFNSAGFSVTTTSPFVFNGGTWASGGSTVTVVQTSGAIFTAQSSSTITGSPSFTLPTSASSRTFAGGGKTYGTLSYTVAGSTGGLTITGSNTFSTINFSDTSNARTLTLTSGTTTTITGLFNVHGSATATMSVISSSAGTPATLSKPNGNVSVDYLSIKDSMATGGASWCAGANSTSVSGNTGWVFAACHGAGSLLLLGVGDD